MAKFSVTFIFLLLIITLPSSALAADVKTDEEFNNFVTYYYLNPRPDRIPQVLKYFLKSNLFRDNIGKNDHTIEMVSYFFGRTANINPKLLRDYEKLYDPEYIHGRLFLITVFAFASDGQNKEFFKKRLDSENDAEMKKLLKQIIDKPPMGNKRLSKGVKDYNDLDFFWIEFFATGEKEPIVKIIDVLGWEDKFRSMLMQWMLHKHSSDEIKKLSDLLNNEVKIAVDVEKAKIIHEGDLDCFYSAYISKSGFAKQRSEPGIEVKNILGISDIDFLYMSTKEVGMWALQSNVK